MVLYEGLTAEGMGRHAVAERVGLCKLLVGYSDALHSACERKTDNEFV